MDLLPDPSPGPNGVVIRVAASGLCLSDWHGWMGHDPDILLPHVPGHEFSGTIAAVGKEVRHWKVGERVTVPFVGGCGQCMYCREGNSQVCDHQFQPGFTAWGSFAELVRIDYADTNLVALPEEFDFISAASLGCRFITAYRAIAEQAGLLPGQWLAVHGCGGVGLSSILIAKALDAKVIAIDIVEGKCALARQLGADYTIDARNANVAEAVHDISGGGVHVSVDAYGHAKTCLNSLHSLRKLGKHVQVGLLPDDGITPQIPMSKVIANELQILGSHGMQAHRYPAMFELIRRKGIRLQELISGTTSLEDAAGLLPNLNRAAMPGITVIDMSL